MAPSLQRSILSPAKRGSRSPKAFRMAAKAVAKAKEPAKKPKATK